jgi:hypothetical protein
VSPLTFPQRASFETFSVDEGAAAVVRVDVESVTGRVLDRTADEDTPEHVPNFALQPFPQYAVVDPQYPYLSPKLV